MGRLLALLLAVLAISPPARAGQLHLDLAGQSLPPLAELVVRGENRDAAPRLVVLRVDDRPSPDYVHRVNAERMVQPGPFTLRLRLALQATPRGRPLDLAALRQAIAFVPEHNGVVLRGLVLEAPPALPEGVRGWSFAPEGAAPLAGFEAVGPDDPRVSGPAPRLVRRPGDDPLLARGMARVTRFAAPLPAGRWRVTLWTEDPGEWETLPPLFEHRVRVNGQDLRYLRRSTTDWVRERYFAGRAVEATRDAPPFETIGARRGGRIEGVVAVGPEGLMVELAGHPHAATHLSAIVAEPADRPAQGVAAVERRRAERFAEDWPVLGRPDPARAANLQLGGPAEAVATAPGGLAVLRFRAVGPGPMPLSAGLAWDGPALPARLLWGQWRWLRPAPETPGLMLSSGHLRADVAALSLPDGLPRELVVLVRVPEGTRPGARTLRLRLAAPDGRSVEAASRIEVLGVQRPAPRARLGAWLDHAPHLQGFEETRGAARRQVACDLDTLAWLGLTAVAPPFATPGDPAHLAEFLDDMRTAAKRFRPPFLAYAPLRRLEEAHGRRGAAEAVRETEAALRAAGLPAPVWTLADEPHGSGKSEDARALALALREAGSDAVLAGHLNDPADAALLPLLGMATVNPRFGADASDIARVRRAGPAPWLYNMPRLRLAGGFYLWRSGADGLLQWHARMPTADAFDPTDGREGDVQFLWPTPEVCGPPDMDADLIAMAEAGEDLRWLAWLEAEAPKRPDAAVLLARLRREVPDRWAAARGMPPEASDRWRSAITALAR